MTYRLATLADAPAVHAQVAAFRAHLGRSVPTDPQLAAGIEALLRAGDAEFVVVEPATGIQGYALLRYRFSLWVAGLEATLEDLFIAPEWRGRGLGQGLVGFALARAQARGCVTMALDSNECNTVSARLYQGLGFSAWSARWAGRQIFYRRSLVAAPEPSCC